MLWRRRPNVRRLARGEKTRRLVRALTYRDFVTDRFGRIYDLGAGTRRDAALALGSVADTDDVDVGSALIEALRDPSAEVRRAAAKALGARHETRAARPLAEAGLSWRDPRYEHARAAATDALFHLSGPEAARALVGTIVERGAEPERARDILSRIIARGRVDTAQSAASTAVLALLHGDGGAAERAAEVLVWLGPAGVEPLLGVVESGNGARLASIRALGRLRDLRSTETLVAFLSDDEPDVRQAAAIALGEIADPRVTRQLLAATSDSDYTVRKAALEAVQALGVAGSLPEFESRAGASSLD
jgi:HEAT repeat protein